MGPLGLLVLLVVSPALVWATPTPVPVDCSDVYGGGGGSSGVYTIYPAGGTSLTQVYCDMGCAGTQDGQQWTVIQRRMDGTVNFYRGWDQYRNGFGPASGEYWLGLENIHILTGKKSYKLRVDMEDFAGAKTFVEYSSFRVGPESDGYVLTLSGLTDGGAGNSLDYHSGRKFSTFDKDQGAVCAKTYLGAWWYGDCHNVNANGQYLWGESLYGIGINWVSWKGYTYSLKAIAFKISPTQ